MISERGKAHTTHHHLKGGWAGQIKNDTPQKVPGTQATARAFSSTCRPAHASSHTLPIPQTLNQQAQHYRDLRFRKNAQRSQASGHRGLSKQLLASCTPPVTTVKLLPSTERIGRRRRASKRQAPHLPNPSLHGCGNGRSCVIGCCSKLREPCPGIRTELAPALAPSACAGVFTHINIAPSQTIN